MELDQQPADAHNPAMPERGWKTIAKWVIAAAVVGGLVIAARRAVDQWRAESTRRIERIAAIDAELAGARPGDHRAALLAERQRLRDSVPRPANLRWRWIAVAAVLYASALVLPSFVLRRALIGLHQHPRLGTVIAAQLIGHLGKYVPGKAMVIVLRVTALAADDVRPLAATAAVFIETFLVMAVGAAVAGLVVLWLPVPNWITATAVGLAVLASVPTLPPVLNPIVVRMSRASGAAIDPQLGCGLVCYGWMMTCCAWLLFGGFFTCLVVAIPSPSEMPHGIELYATSTAAFALAMVIGFASLLPGGAGVRELVMVTVLGATCGAAHGLLAAIAARLVSILVESLLAGCAWWWLRYTRNHPNLTGNLRKP